MTLFQIKVDDKTVKIGDFVRFKSDVKETGEVIKIVKSLSGQGFDVMLINEEGFIGKDIGGKKIITIRSYEIL